MTAEKLNYDTYEVILKTKNKEIELLQDKLECSENFTAIYMARATAAENKYREFNWWTRFIISLSLIAITILSIHYYRMQKDYLRMREKIDTLTQYENGNRQLESGTHN